ncbi:MAG: hypothetical protein JWM99_4608 [Verrucomicrobiales bacterium]|nr:hypothetical protein [Verrucomicrobiales bacterium]
MLRIYAIVLFLGGFLSFVRGASYEQAVSVKFGLTDLAVPFTVRDPKPGTPFQEANAPFEGLRAFGSDSMKRVWLASTNGAVRFDSRSLEPWDRWRVFAGKRWLLDDDVRAIWIDPNIPSKIWIRTASGASLIEFQRYTLEKKAAYFEDRIQARHVRHGLIADCEFKNPGDLSTFAPASSDNDGLWSAIYIAAESYRYAITGAPDAKRNAYRSVEALMRLEEITGIPGFPARSYVSLKEKLPLDGEWHLTPDGQWHWKGDTSSDEIVGHYYAYSTYYDLVADRKEREAIRRVITRITDHIIDHEWNLIDLDGKPTLWGQWSETYFDSEKGRDDQGLNALELLSFLKTAYHITALPRFKAAYEDRLKRGYAQRMTYYRSNEINFSDDELAYLSWQPLLKYERDPVLRAQYLPVFKALASVTRSDRNPLWNFIVMESLSLPASDDLIEPSRRSLERIPMDLVTWTVHNSARKNLKYRPGMDRFGRRELVDAFAPDERPVARWNSNPYYPDGGGDGHTEDDGAFFLLPYWLGRYHRWIK